jgi:hypothetical protein
MVHATNRAIAMSRSSKVRTRTAAVYRADPAFPGGPGPIRSSISGPRPIVNHTGGSTGRGGTCGSSYGFTPSPTIRT